MMYYLCPVCRAPLMETGAAFVCPRHHSFDRAREGYVNLLVGKTNAGDNRTSVLSRHAFLSSGAYEQLRECLMAIVRSVSPAEILDIGCGEGYYDELLSRPWGIDISREAVRLASRNKGHYAVASSARLPFPDHVFSLILSIFAPLDLAEACRVLALQGRILKVTPAPDHLKELKSLLYVDPITRSEKRLDLPVVHEERLAFPLRLTNARLMDLVAMTPYAYTTAPEALASLSCLSSLNVTASFIMTLYANDSTH